MFNLYGPLKNKGGDIFVLTQDELIEKTNHSGLIMASLPDFYEAGKSKHKRYVSNIRKYILMISLF